MVTILTCKNLKNGKDEIVLVKDKNFIRLQDLEIEKMSKFFLERLRIGGSEVKINYVDLTGIEFRNEDE